MSKDVVVGKQFRMSMTRAVHDVLLSAQYSYTSRCPLCGEDIGSMTLACRYEHLWSCSVWFKEALRKHTHIVESETEGE